MDVVVVVVVDVVVVVVVDVDVVVVEVVFFLFFLASKLFMFNSSMITFVFELYCIVLLSR